MDTYLAIYNEPEITQLSDGYKLIADTNVMIDDRLRTLSVNGTGECSYQKYSGYNANGDIYVSAVPLENTSNFFVAYENLEPDVTASYVSYIDRDPSTHDLRSVLIAHQPYKLKYYLCGYPTVPRRQKGVKPAHLTVYDADGRITFTSRAKYIPVVEYQYAMPLSWKFGKVGTSRYAIAQMSKATRIRDADGVTAFGISDGEERVSAFEMSRFYLQKNPWSPFFMTVGGYSNVLVLDTSNV